MLYDLVTYPALAELGSDIRHHAPLSYAAAEAASRAHGAEGSGRATTRAARLTILIRPQSLGPFWQSVTATLSRSRNADHPLQAFREPFFLYDSADHKLEFRRPESINATINRFWNDYSRRIRRIRPRDGAATIHQQYIDLAAELLPQSNRHGRGTVVLPRRCCQRTTLRFLFGDGEDVLDPGYTDYDGAGSAAGSGRSANPDPPFTLPRSTTTEYHIFTLRDSVTATYEPRISSEYYRFGLRYFQSYSVTEELFGKGGTQPFSHPGLPNLVYGKRQWDSIATAAKIERSRDHLDNAFLASIHRVNKVLDPGNPVDFGHRIELRITPELADLVQLAEASYCANVLLVNGRIPAVRPSPSPEDSLGFSSSPPATERVSAVFDLDDDDQVTATWTIPDYRSFYFVALPDLNLFVRGNVDKHLLVLDSVSAFYNCSSAYSQTPQAVATLFALVVLSLRHFLSYLHPKTRWMLESPLARDSDPDLPARLVRPGLGLRETMIKRGFAFWPDIVDWQAFGLLPGWEEKLTIPDFQRLRRHDAVRKLRLDNSFFDQLLEVYARRNLGRQQSMFLQDLAVHFLLRAYRQTALEKLFTRSAMQEPDVRAFYEEDTLKFDLQSLTTAIEQHGNTGVNLVLSNRSALLHGRCLFDWLWTDKDMKPDRKRIKDLPFRYFLQRVMTADRDPCNPFLSADSLLNLLFYRFFQQHTAVPYPDSEGSFASTAKGSRARNLCAWEYLPATANIDSAVPSCVEDVVKMFHGTRYKGMLKTKTPFLPPASVLSIVDIDGITAALSRWSDIGPRKRKSPI